MKDLKQQMNGDGVEMPKRNTTNGRKPGTTSMNSDIIEALSDISLRLDRQTDIINDKIDGIEDKINEFSVIPTLLKTIVALAGGFVLIASIALGGNLAIDAGIISVNQGVKVEASK